MRRIFYPRVFFYDFIFRKKGIMFYSVFNILSSALYFADFIFCLLAICFPKSVKVTVFVYCDWFIGFR